MVSVNQFTICKDNQINFEENPILALSSNSVPVYEDDEMAAKLLCDAMNLFPAMNHFPIIFYGIC